VAAPVIFAVVELRSRRLGDEGNDEMISAMTALGIAVGGTLICYLLLARSQNRRTGRGSSRDGFSGTDGGGIVGGDSGGHFGGFGGNHSPSDNSGNPGDAGGGDSGGGSDGGGGGGGSD
jgi:hypothetical protein